MDEKEARSAVMGAISMALKDPTLQQGFEIICKENAELRKDFIESEEDNNKLRENIYKIDVAKDLLLRFVELKNKPCASGHSINMLLYENICAEAEQFLSEVEK